jgi:hypothetical protein
MDSLIGDHQLRPIQIYLDLRVYPDVILEERYANQRKCEGEDGNDGVDHQY